MIEYKNLHIKDRRPESVEEDLNYWAKKGWKVVSSVRDSYHDQVRHEVHYLVLERETKVYNNEIPLI